MRKLTTSIVSSLAALMLLAGSALAETETDAILSFTVTDNAPISITAAAGDFASITYDDTKAPYWYTSGHVTFTVSDPRYAKGDWAVSVSSPGVESSGVLVTPASSIGLASVNTFPGITTHSYADIANDGALHLLFTADDTFAAPGASMSYQAVVGIPTKSTPGTYTATITVNLASTRD